MKNLDIYTLYLIYDHLTNQEVGLLQLVNKNIHNNILIYQKYLINQLLKNNYYSIFIKNIILNNRYQYNYICNSEIIEKLNEKSIIYILGISYYSTHCSLLYKLYFNKYFQEYRFVPIIKSHMNYFNKHRGIQLIYLGGELMFIMHNKIKIYNILTNHWYNYNIIGYNENSIQCNKVCCVYNNQIYVTQSYWNGDNEFKKYSSFPLSILEFDDCKFILKIFSLSSMLLKSRMGHSMIAFNNKLWVAGGKHEDEYLNDIEIFDFKLGIWKIQISKMNRKRINFKLEVIENELYAIGGDIDYNDLLITIEKYDNIKNKWIIITSKSIVIYHSYVVLENKIFLFTNDLEEYNKVICYIYNTINNYWIKTNINIDFFKNAHLHLIGIN